MMALLLAMQDAPAEALPPAILDIDFDLTHAPPPSDDPNVIIVRGRRVDRRLPMLPALREELFPRLGAGLLGGKAGFTTEAKELPGGVTSSRVMLKWKLAF